MVERVECPVCHNLVGKRHGRLVKHQPCDDVQYGTPPTDPYDRAMRHTRRCRGHLLWTGYLVNGVPMLQVRKPDTQRTPTGGGRTSVSIRRIVWTRHHGEPPAGAMVVASCGWQRCIALEHLATLGEATLPRLEEARRRREQRERLWAERRAAIAADYNAGVLLVVIKAKYGVEATAIYKAVRAAGGEPNRGGGRYDRSRGRTEDHASV